MVGQVQTGEQVGGQVDRQAVQEAVSTEGDKAKKKLQEVRKSSVLERITRYQMIGWRVSIALQYWVSITLGGPHEEITSLCLICSWS